MDGARSIYSIALAVASALLWALCGAAAAGKGDLAEPKVEYQADSYMGSEKHVVKSRVYHAPGKHRMDMDDVEGKQYVITREDKKVSWMVLPEQKMYMEMSIEEGRKKSEDITQCSFSQKAAGKEEVNGISTTRSEIEVSCPDKSEYSGTMWTSKEGIMVKMDAVAKQGSGKKGRFRLELKNLKTGKVDPKVFEIPAGYRLMKMPTGIMPGGAGAERKRAGKEAPRAAQTPALEREEEDRADPEPTAEEPPVKEKGTVEKAVEPLKKMKSLFGW